MTRSVEDEASWDAGRPIDKPRAVEATGEGSEATGMLDVDVLHSFGDREPIRPPGRGIFNRQGAVNSVSMAGKRPTRN